MFDQADTDQKGLSEYETISLMKKLNNQLSTVRLRQKIMVRMSIYFNEYNFFNVVHNTGLLNSSCVVLQH